MKKDDRRTLVVVVAVCLICILIIFLVSRKSNMDKLSPVDDYGTFFSVVREIDNYINYTSNSDSGNILNILDDKYLNNNNINRDNVFDFISNYSVLSNFNANSIEYVKIGNNYLYLVSGKIIENDFDTINIIDNDYRVMVLCDIDNNSYSIYPLNKDNYKKIVNGVKKINIDSNSSNKMISAGNLDDVEVCKLYFSNYIDKLFNNVNDAYELLSDDMKKRFTNYEEFNKYINDNMSKITSSSKLCNKDEYKGNRVYTVIDNNDNSYSFSENGVMNYKVNFYFKSDEE